LREHSNMKFSQPGQPVHELKGSNPYEVTEEDVWDVLGSIGGTSNVLDDDCEGEESEVEPIPSYSDLQSSFGTMRRYMESRSRDVRPSMWVCWCRLIHICELCMQMNLTKAPLIHTSPVICKLDIE
jgi:hypothetical protein